MPELDKNNSRKHPQRRLFSMNTFEELHANIELTNITKHNFDTLTFLKSNYKYKRRCDGEATAYATSCNCSGNCGQYCGIDAPDYAKSKSDKFSSRVILRVFLVIVGNLMQHKLAARLLHYDEAAAAAADGANGAKCVGKVAEVVAAGLNNDVNADSDEINYQRNYDKVSTPRCQNAARYQRRRQRHRRRRLHWPTKPNTLSDLSMHTTSSAATTPSSSSSSSTSPKPSSMSRLSVEPSASRVNVLSILMALFMAVSLSTRTVEAGACWQTTLDNGKCNEIFSLNISKFECCGANQEFSYTDRELTSVEYFFATAIGGGMECAPCIESCKNVNCGANKKCVKRKGRPKCICAPECGAAMRRKQREKFWHEHHNDQASSAMAKAAAEAAEARTGAGDAAGAVVGTGAETMAVLGKSPRDIRSLSSEITNVNLGLDGVMHHQNQRNQRKILILQSQSQQKPQIIKREPQPRRLLIAANVEHADKPTTRRLQILSNVRTHNHNNNGERDGAGDGNERRGKNDDSTNSARSGSSMSRHRSNTNNHPNKKRNRNNAAFEVTKSQQEDSENNRNNNNKRNNNNNNSKMNNRNNNARVRHIHQNSEDVEKNAPNHDKVDGKHHHERHQQIHRKRKHHNRSRQKKLKDHSANSTRIAETETAPAAATTTTTSATTSTRSTLPASSLFASSAESGYNATTTATRSAAETTKTAAQTTTTPANSTSSADHTLLNRGSTSATSPSSSSSSAATLSSSTAAAAPAVALATAAATSFATPSVGGGVSVDYAGGSNSVNSDDLTFLDGIYDKFNLHGFPSQQHAVTQFENMHSPHPVCGTDGRTYNTECQMKKRACRTDNPNLQVAYRGHCKTTCNGVKCLNGLTCVEDHYTIPHCIVCKIDCPQDDERHDVIDTSRAVCGIDGNTYRSTCDINRMICKIGRSIAVAYPGPCREDRVTCGDINCGPKHTCLVDLLTHEPRCVSCRYKCSRKRRPASLRSEEGKICGVNNRTYNSWCEMRKDSCSTGFFIDVKSPGGCT